VVAFTTSCIVLALLVGGIVLYGKRRPVDAALTWGEAMAAAVYIFFVLFWAYGVVPHLWLAWADNDLKWRPDKLFLLPRSKTTACEWKWGTGKGCLKWPLPITISWQTLRDIIVVILYNILIGINVVLFASWQKRGKTKAVEVAKSDFGRPLVKEAAR
jgi:hypothetical protein